MKRQRRNAGIVAKRALVLEDELSLAELCQRVLSAEGFDVDVAPDGVMAKRMLNQKDYHLLLLDIRTPRINGTQVYRAIESRATQLVSRVLFTTGDVLDQHTRDFLQRTHRPVLPKPFGPSELRQAVRRLMQERELER
jgi:DNA-binding response OmpR family regulator